VIKSEVTLVNKLGLHARAAAKFVSCAASFSSSVKVGRDGELVDGKSIMSVMMLAAAKGTTLTLVIEGEDAEDACEAIHELVANRFDEPE